MRNPTYLIPIPFGEKAKELLVKDAFFRGNGFISYASRFWITSHPNWTQIRSVISETQQLFMLICLGLRQLQFLDQCFGTFAESGPVLGLARKNNQHSKCLHDMTKKLKLDAVHLERWWQSAYDWLCLNTDIDTPVSLSIKIKITSIKHEFWMFLPIFC